METIETILSHRTIRKYKETPIEDAILKQILEAGFRTSTTGNMQVYSIIVTKEKELKNKLWEIANALQDGLKREDFNIGSTKSPITPVYMSGTEWEAANLALDLRENHGIFCTVVVYPIVPKDTILLRLIPTAVHSLEDVDRTIKAFAACRKKLVNNEYDSEKINFI